MSGSVSIETPEGPARAYLEPAEDPVGALALGHGAAGSVDAPDLRAAGSAASAAGFTVALVEQPYRVAGRRSSPPARRLDAAWTACMEHLRAGELSGLPLVVGGRAAGARVACRTAADTGAVAVLCLAFPLQPRRRSGAAASRLPELDAVGLPTLVVQGEADQFGIPPAGPARSVVTVPGNHSLRAGLEEVEVAVREWLPGVGS